MIESEEMRARKPTFIFVLPLLLMGCFSNTPIRQQADFEAGAIYKSDKEAPIPRSLVQHLEQIYIQSFRDAQPDSTLTDIEIALKVPRRLLRVSVFLNEKNLGTLQSNLKFEMPHGGGAIDLADSVNQGKGLFYLDFDFPELSQEQKSQLKVFYISNAKRFQISGQTVGAGCGQFFEVTQFFHDVIHQVGYELAAADFRYLGQMVGTFLFSYIEPNVLHIASVTFIDSRYPNIHCMAVDR